MVKVPPMAVPELGSRASSGHTWQLWLARAALCCPCHEAAHVVLCADTYAPGPPYCTYGLRVPASCVLHVPEAQGSLP